MLEKNRKGKREDDMAMALAVLLQNILILIVLGGCVWMLYSMFEQNASFSPFLRGGFLP